MKLHWMSLPYSLLLLWCLRKLVQNNVFSASNFEINFWIFRKDFGFQWYSMSLFVTIRYDFRFFYIFLYVIRFSIAIFKYFTQTHVQQNHQRLFSTISSFSFHSGNICFCCYCWFSWFWCCYYIVRSMVSFVSNEIYRKIFFRNTLIVENLVSQKQHFGYML